MWTDDAALDATGRRLAEWESSVAERAERMRALAARMQVLTGTASSPDRMIEVTVDSSGLLVDLRLDEHTRQQSAARTARQIVETTAAARADLLRHVTETTRKALGDDDPTGLAVVDSYRRRLGPEQGTPDARR